MDNKQYLIKLRELLKQNNQKDEYITTCIDYASDLLTNNLPVIFDCNHFALLLGLEYAELCSFIAVADINCYSEIQIPKKSGQMRVLSVPSKKLKHIQKWIQVNIIDKFPVSDFAMGFYKNRSIVTNAQKHVCKDCLINIDLKDFFPSIDFEKVFMIFKYYGYTKEVSYILAKLCTYKGVLPQGSPASPGISNVACLKLDKRLSKLAETNYADYSRYADDITFSGAKSIKKLLPTINNILNEEGYVINPEKTRVTFKNQRQEVTGLNVNTKTVKVAKSYKRSFKAEIYYCLKYGVSNHQDRTNDDHAFYKEHMYGKAYFIHMVEPNLGKQLLNKLEQIKWEY